MVDLTTVGLILMIVGKAAPSSSARSMPSAAGRPAGRRIRATRPISATERGGAYAAARGWLARSRRRPSSPPGAPDIVLVRRPPDRPDWRRAGPAARASAAVSAPASAGSTSTPASGVTNSGGPPIVVAMTERSIAIASSGPDRTARSATAGRARRGGDPARDLGVGDAARERRRRRGPRARRAAARRRRRPGVPARAREGVGQRDHVLALDQRADAEEAGPAPPSRAPGARAGIAGREGVEVDPAVVIAVLGRPPGSAASGGEPARVRDHGRRRATTGAVAGVTPRIRPRFATSWPWAITTRGAAARRAPRALRRPGREQEVGEDDVGAGCGAPRRPSRRRAAAYFCGPPPRRLIETTSTSWPSAPISRRQRDEEAAEIGVLRAGPHLGHEQDPHRTIE